MADDQHDLLIIYTSKNGRTGSMVEPIRQGILDGGASATARTVQEVQWDEMLAAKGIIVGTPTRFGDVDWQIKQLFDIYPAPIVGQGRRGLRRRRQASRTTIQDYPGPLSGKVGGAFAGGGRPGSGAELALLSMIHILLNHGMVIQGNAHSSHYGPVMLSESSQDEVVSICNAWGRHWADLVQRLYGGS